MSTIRKALAITAVLVLSTALFASGINESKIEFSSLDLSSASVEDIKSSFEDAKSDYQSDKEKLEESISKAYRNKDVSEYLELRELYRGLEYPVITEEQTETLTERIVNSTDDEEKKSLSDFLYENSKYYHPTLTLYVKYESNGRIRSYKKTIVKEPGESVTLPTATSYYSQILNGWGITEDEVLYTPGEEITMPYTDTVLYGVLSTGISFTDSVTGYSYTTEEGSADVVVPEAPDSSYVFVGWYDSTGKEVDGDTVTVEDGESRTYKAYWKSVQLDEGSVKYYSDNTVPANTQVKYTTSVTVGGNTDIRGLTLKLEETEGLKVLTKNQSFRTLSSGDTGSASFVIVLKGNSGDIIETALTATDSDGNEWSIPVSFTVR